ncbi:helix-turn-helix domain-containing protein [Vineibacter terrae]|uniref:Helix-turn-helix domain-containing protein n=1 Tax=Vineibacter terrae TaxID=2586908 RepID=A0A5C8PSN0_9HYPH|nr:helix-turn-helix domain-containing protein [Vineibacter terrae]TXL80350.1 helix-turn-helix domain-containing protein [Vineibacter terrae]
MTQIARTPKQIGDVLRRQRRRLGISQTQLGEKTGLRQATVSTLEAGQPGTALRTLCDVMAALDLELVVRPRSKAAPDRIEDIF